MILLESSKQIPSQFLLTSSLIHSTPSASELDLYSFAHQLKSIPFFHDSDLSPFPHFLPLLPSLLSFSRPWGVCSVGEKQRPLQISKTGLQLTTEHTSQLVLSQEGLTCFRFLSNGLIPRDCKSLLDWFLTLVLWSNTSTQRAREGKK